VALLTALDGAAARAILDAYGLDLESLRALPEKGTVNSNFRVRASGREWFLRVNEGKREADVAGEARLVSHLVAHGVPTPPLVPTRDGRPYYSYDNKFVSLFPWVAGVEAQALTHLEAAGRALQAIHAAGEIDELPRNHYTLDELSRRLESFAADGRFAEVVPALERELDRARGRARGGEGLIHQDLFPDNLLVDEDGALAAVLDFEQATRGPFVYDLAVLLNAWCWDGRAILGDAVQAVIAAYRPLSTEEERLLTEEGALAAARFCITRITDIELRAGVDPDLRQRKDWREYARRLAWWRRA
jgi:homoserine kinase type II